MAREAAIRVSLAGGAFLSGLKDMERDTKRIGRNMGKGLRDSLKQGADAARGSLRGMTDSLKTGLKQAATLGGAVSFGLFAREAMQLEEASGRVAAKLRRMGEAGTTIRAPLDVAKDAAQRFNATAGEMLTAYEALVDETGDPVFSRDALESVALAQNAFRMTAEQAAGLVGAMQEAGLGANEIKSELLPALLDLSNRGGAGIQNITDASGKILSTMAAVGLKGKAGFGTVVGMLNLTDSQGAPVEARLSAISKILLKLGSTKEVKKLGINQKELASTNGQLEVMQKILSKQGGFKKLKELFGKSEKTAGVFNEMVKPYVEAIDRATAEGKSADVAIKIAAEAFAQSIKESTEVTSTEATVRDEAAKRAQEASRRFELALDRMKQIFADEKFLNAMTRLATEVLPKVTDAFVKVTEFASDNPITAAALLPGAAIAMNAVSAAMVAATGKSLAGFGGILAGMLKGKGAVETAKAATRIVKPGDLASMVRGGAAAAGGAGAATAAGGAGAAGAAGAAGTAAAGGAAIAGAGLAAGAGIVAMAGLLAGTIGAHGRRDTLDEANRTADEADMVGDDHGSRAAAIGKLMRARREVENTSAGTMFDTMSEKMSGAVPMERLKEHTLERLDEALAKLTATAERAADKQSDLATATTTTTRSIDRLGTTGAPASRGAGASHGTMPYGNPGAGASGDI